MKVFLSLEKIDNPFDFNDTMGVGVSRELNISGDVDEDLVGAYAQALLDNLILGNNISVITENIKDENARLWVTIKNNKRQTGKAHSNSVGQAKGVQVTGDFKHALFNIKIPKLNNIYPDVIVDFSKEEKIAEEYSKPPQPGDIVEYLPLKDLLK